MADPELRSADPGDTVSVPDATQADHGKILVEYVNEPHDGHTYALTDRGVVLRMFYGSPFRLYYTVALESIPEQVAALRASPSQRVTVDRWVGRLPTIEHPDLSGGKGRKMATTKERERAKPETAKAEKGKDNVKEDKKPKPEKEKAPKAQRLGARARRLLETGLGLSDTRQKEVLAAADGIARKRDDAMTRIWDIYEAAGAKMPDGIAAEKKEFMETGKMPKSRASDAPKKEGQGNARPAEGAPAHSPSKTPSESPESKQTESGEATQKDGAEATGRETSDETL